MFVTCSAPVIPIFEKQANDKAILRDILTRLVGKLCGEKERAMCAYFGRVTYMEIYRKANNPLYVFSDCWALPVRTKSHNGNATKNSVVSTKAIRKQKKSLDHKGRPLKSTFERPFAIFAKILAFPRSTKNVEESKVFLSAVVTGLVSDDHVSPCLMANYTEQVCTRL